MSLTNPNTPVSQQDLQDFYHKILPYIGGSNEGGSNYTAGDGIDITNDVISTKQSSPTDMDEIIEELPSGGNISVTGYVPLATIIPVYSETAPKFFLACDGTTYNKADYPELANHLLSLTYNTPYVVDGDDTKFKVPDLRGEFIRGTGTNGHNGEGSGANVGVHQDASYIPAITTYIESNSKRCTTIYYNGTNVGEGVGNLDAYTATTRYADTWSTNADGARAGSSAIKLRPTNTSVLYCIAYKDIYTNPMNNYSTTEKVIGTWIDGKPLYQKTFTGTVPTFTSPSNSALNPATLNIAMGCSVDVFVSVSGFVQTAAGNYIPFPFTETTKNVTYKESSSATTLDSYSQLITVFGRPNASTSMPNNIRVVNMNQNFNDRPLWVTAQYTKTTD